MGEGQIFGLIGANGAGKSTFIKLLVGATKSDAGHLRVLGLEPRKNKADLRQQIGYMPQTPALYEDLTAAENLRFFGQAHRLNNLKEQVETTLEFVELSQRADDPVNTLSGGMKQRVSLACALVHQPRLLLLDEPSMGLAPQLVAEIFAAIVKLSREGMTMLLVEQNAHAALSVADFGYVIETGRTVMSARGPELLADERVKQAYLGM